MSTFNVNANHEQLSPLSNRFLVAHSSPVHENNSETIVRAHDESFQSSSSTSNSKSGSSTTSRSSRLQYLLTHHQQSAVNSPLMYSRCTSLGSLSSYDIRSSYNESYTSECSSVKPSGLISPSDMPDSPPCEPEVLEEEEEEEEERNRISKPINRTLTLNTTSSQNRTTMMSETVIEKTFVFNQQQQQHLSITNSKLQFNEIDDDEHLDEVIVYSYETSETNQKSSYENQLIFDDDSYRVFTTQTDENDSFSDEPIEAESSIQAISDVPVHENLSIITEESSFIEELNSNDENNSIRILYDLIKKPHWTRKTNLPHLSHVKSLSHPSNHLLRHSLEETTSVSSNPSSLSLDSISASQTDDEDEYDQEKGRQLIQRLIEETLARRSLPTDFLHSASCVLCPSNTPVAGVTRTISSSSSSSISASIKSCTCANNKRFTASDFQPQRSQSSPARASSSSSYFDESKRIVVKPKDKTVQQTRSSFLRLQKTQQNKRVTQSDKRI